MRNKHQNACIIKPLHEGNIEFSRTLLLDPDRYIRLTEIHDADTTDGALSCTLTIWLTSDAPTYQAISYTWGNENSTARILVNDQELHVRVNCEYTLRQARWHGGSRYFWIDSVCINQTDLVERTRQVAQMDQVFRNASNVLACVGPHSDGSELLLQFLGEHADFPVDSISAQTASGIDENGVGSESCKSATRRRAHKW